MNYEEKYLKYKMKYLDLKTGGLFGLKSSPPRPTPLSKYPRGVILSSEEKNIDGINMKIDIVDARNGQESSPYDPGSYSKSTKITVFSLSDNLEKKNYIPYYEFFETENHIRTRRLDVLIDGLLITKRKVNPEYFNMLSPDLLKAYDAAIGKQLNLIITRDYKSEIEELRKEITKIISDKESELRKLESIDIKEEIIEEEKQKIVSKINEDIEKLREKIRELELLKTNEVERLNSPRYIEEKTEYYRKTKEYVVSDIKHLLEERERILSYLSPVV